MGRWYKGREVNRNGLASFFGVSLPTINAWVGQDMPVIERGRNGKQWRFNTADVLKWRIDKVLSDNKNSSLGEEEVRREINRIKLKSNMLDYERKIKNIAPVNDIKKIWENIVIEIQTSIENVGERLAPLIANETNKRKIKELIDNEYRIALETLSKFDVQKLIEVPEEEDSNRE